jgi:hypothetical protein
MERKALPACARSSGERLLSAFADADAAVEILLSARFALFRFATGGGASRTSGIEFSPPTGASARRSVPAAVTFASPQASNEFMSSAIRETPENRRFGRR